MPLAFAIIAIIDLIMLRQRPATARYYIELIHYAIAIEYCHCWLAIDWHYIITDTPLRQLYYITASIILLLIEPYYALAADITLLLHYYILLPLLLFSLRHFIALADASYYAIIDIINIFIIADMPYWYADIDCLH